MGDKILKSLQFPGSSDVYKIPQSDYAQTDSTQPDYIKNKLVGKEVTYSDTLTWDGNTEGLESVVIMDGIGYYRVSDATPSFDYFSNGCTLVCNANGEEQTISIASTDIASEGNIITINMEGEPVAIITLIDNFDWDGLVFPKKGIYLNKMDMSGYLVFYSALTISGQNIFPTTTTKKLTAEYLEPFEVVTKGGDTLTWDGDTSGLESVGGMAYKITDKTPSMNDFASGAKLIKDSATTEIPQNGIFQDGEIIFVGSEVCMIALQDNASAYEGEIILPSKGIWIIPQDFSIFSLTIPNYTGFVTTTKKLKGEYVIDTNSIILKSYGGKRFRVTVSDNGTLTATEI